MALVTGTLPKQKHLLLFSVIWLLFVFLLSLAHFVVYSFSLQSIISPVPRLCSFQRGVTTTSQIKMISTMRSPLWKKLHISPTTLRRPTFSRLLSCMHPQYISSMSRFCSSTSCDNKATHTLIPEATAVIKSIPLALTPSEEKLFDWFKQVVQEKHLNTTVRVAGGWVRDRVLGLPGKDDVDIALDNMTGLEFVSVLNGWNEEHGINKVKFGIIQQNPEKSKHLETVSLQCDTLSVDFVNLRTETYTNSSRIPTIAIGTPIEDAFRRDLTINSLFYNIHTNEIEDFTGQGLQDLHQQIVRTPLEPYITLTDDPLRALRALRFACRFNFTIDKELLKVCCSNKVHQLLLQKVSRERIAVEIELMMKTKQFSRAWYILMKTNILKSIIPLPQRLLKRKLHRYRIDNDNSNKMDTTISIRKAIELEKHRIQSSNSMNDDSSNSSISSKVSELQSNNNNKRKKNTQKQQHEQAMLDCLLISYDLLLENDIESKYLYDNFHNNSVLSVLMSHYLYCHHMKNSLQYYIQNALYESFEQDEVRRVFMYGLALLPTADFFALPDQGKSKVNHLSVAILKHGLKLSQKDFRLLDKLLQHIHPFVHFLQHVQTSSTTSQSMVTNINHTSNSFMQGEKVDDLLNCVYGGDTVNGLNRLELGLAIDAIGISHYRQVVLLAAIKLIIDTHYRDNSTEWIEKLAKYLKLSPEKQTGIVSNDISDDDMNALDEQLRNVMVKANSLLEVIKTLKLDDEYWPLVPIVDGHELLQKFSKLSKGSTVGDILLIQKKWMLCNPRGTKEDLLAFIEQHFPQLA